MKQIEKEILSEVIIHYIQHLEPIGSAQLKDLVAVELSSATIRNYFKKLVDAGLLTQLHSSSGRIPTNRALKEYWQEQILFGDMIDIDLQKIDCAAKQFRIFSLVQSRRSNRLLATDPSGDHLVATFENGAAIVKKSAVIERLLHEFEGYDIADIISISKSSQIASLLSSLWALRKNSIYRFNASELINIASQEGWSEDEFDLFYGGELAENMRAGIFYDGFSSDGFTILAQNAHIQQDPALVIAFGATSRNFGAFIQQITKED